MIVDVGPAAQGLDAGPSIDLERGHADPVLEGVGDVRWRAITVDDEQSRGSPASASAIRRSSSAGQRNVTTSMASKLGTRYFPTVSAR